MKSFFICSVVIFLWLPGATLMGQSSLLTDLEEYYKLDEASGQAIDAVGNINSSAVDATQGVSGILGTSYQFNGTNQEITFADHANWTVNTTDNLSVSMWINFTDDITHTWATLWGHQNGPQLYLTFKSAGNYTLGWWTGGSNGTESNTLSFSPNTWYHIVFVKNGSSIAFYRNGSAVGTANVTGYNVNPIALYIGGDTYSTPQAFKGKIDELGIWKKELSGTEVFNLYNSGTGLSYPFQSGQLSLSAPSSLTASASSSNVTLSWTDNATEETGFSIERKSGTGSYGEIATVGANVTSYTDEGLSANITYTYRVKAYNSSESSSYSNETSAFIGSAGAFEAQYNGNISQINWKVAIEGSADKKQYTYNYDALNRITESYYSNMNNIIHLGAYNEGSIKYDLNGNIKRLQRTGMDMDEVINSMDNLEYTYLGNQLFAVKDNADVNKGYIDITDTGNPEEYKYDDNGNLISDINKKITDIDYNILNLPEKILYETGDYIVFTYDATGRKLQKQIFKNGNVLFRTTQYVGNIEYEEGNLTIIHEDEGVLRKNEENNTFGYEYFLKDHLGNTRAVIDETGTILQATNYYPFGLAHNPINPNNDNKYLYNGKELTSGYDFNSDLTADIDLSWYDYGMRQYDPQIGRFTTQDLLAEKYFDWTPYNYVGNNPVLRIDLLGLDWYTDKDGTYQYDPKINEKSKLQEGQKYVGKKYEARNSDGNLIASYRKDGSIQYTSRMDALQRVYDNTQKTGKEELAIMTKGGGALVTPDYKNTTSSCNPFEFYNYSFDKKGNILDADGNSFAADGSIHTHPYDKGTSSDNQPDPFPSGTNWGAGDLETFSLVTPYKPAMTMGWDGKVYGVFGSYKNNSGNNSDLKWGWLTKSGDYTVQEILKSSGKLQIIMNSTFIIK